MNSFKERQARRLSLSQPTPKPSKPFAPVNIDGEFRKQLEQVRNLRPIKSPRPPQTSQAGDINIPSSVYPDASKFLADRSPKWLNEFSARIKRLNDLNVKAFSAEKLTPAQALELDSRSKITEFELREFGLSVFQGDIHPDQFDKFSAVVWTNDHGAYRVFGPKIIDRQRSSKWKLVLFFNNLEATATSTVVKWKIFDPKNRWLNGSTDPISVCSGDVLKLSYTLNL